MGKVITKLKKKLKRSVVRFNILWVKMIAGKAVVAFNNILVLSPHPDDEIIGLGGLILQILKSGGQVHIVYLTDGESSCSYPDKERIKEERYLLTKKILSELIIPQEQTYRLHLEDEGVPRQGHKHFFEVSEKLTEIIEKVNPDAVFATHFLDRHSDHVACFELAKEALLKANHKSTLWFYWVWTWFRLYPWDLFKTIKSRKINIKLQYKRKKELMDIYLTPESPAGVPWSGNLPEMMHYPFPYEIIEKHL